MCISHRMDHFYEFYLKFEYDIFLGAPQVADIDFRQNLVSLEGDRLKLPCKVIGSPRPFKIWYKDQRQLSAKYDNR